MYSQQVAHFAGNMAYCLNKQKSITSLLASFFPFFLLQVLPKPGQLIVQPQARVAPPPPSIPSERSNAEVSSGAGELSDSVSVGEVAVSGIRKKKLKVETELN